MLIAQLNSLTHTHLICFLEASLSLLRRDALQELLSIHDRHWFDQDSHEAAGRQAGLFLVFSLIPADPLLIYSSLRGIPGY